MMKQYANIAKLVMKDICIDNLFTPITNQGNGCIIITYVTA